MGWRRVGRGRVDMGRERRGRDVEGGRRNMAGDREITSVLPNILANFELISLEYGSRAGESQGSGSQSVSSGVY